MSPRQRRRFGRPRDHLATRPLTTCPRHGGKGLYVNRDAARAAGRSAHPGDHLSAYACDVLDGFHYGHMPADHIAGETTDWKRG